MKYNSLMKPFLEKVDMNKLQPNIISEYDCSIERKYTELGELFWCAGDFCGLEEEAIKETDPSELSYLERDGNEIYIRINDNSTEEDVLVDALAVLRKWKYILSKEEVDTRFIIFLSIDNISDLGDTKEEAAISATIRFWAVREGESPMDLEYLEDYVQPILYEEVNE